MKKEGITMKEKEFLNKGFLTFYLTQEGLTIRTINRDDYISSMFPNMSMEEYESITDFKFNKTIYSMFDGQEFVDMIKKGCITSYDGFISEIYVDGYLSNLGIISDTFEDGEFLVSIEMFEELCQDYEVLVNWANK